MATVTYIIINGRWTIYPGGPYTSDPIVKEYNVGDTMTWYPDRISPNDGWSTRDAYWTPYDPRNQECTGNAAFTYHIVTPVYTVTYKILNGQWTTYAGGPYTADDVVNEYVSGDTMTWYPDRISPNDGWSIRDAYWSPSDPRGQVATGNRTFVYNIITPVYTVTYRIIHGRWSSWAGGPITADDVVKEYVSGDTMDWYPPTVVADDGWSKDGATWSPFNPINQPAAGNNIFLYSMAGMPYTVTYRITNGTWSDGTTTPKTETVRNEGSPANIPTNMRPNKGYGDGEWTPDPYGAIITGDTSFSYMFYNLPPGDDIPRMAQVKVFYRLKRETQTRAGEQTSEWIQKGEYYIDTRTTTSNDDNLNILEAQCFDSMLKANAMYGSSAITFPAIDTDVVAEICTKLGFVQDSRNASVLTNGYTIPSITSDMTMRDVLSYIGVMYAANWVFSDEGKLRIIPLVNIGDTLSVNKSVQNITTSPKRQGYTKVSITVSDTKVIESGVSDDNVMEAVCPWMTQAIADRIYSILSQFKYHPCTASGVWSDPAVEIGDTLVTDTTTSQIYAMDADYGSVVFMDLSAPNDNYIEHEYAYYSPGSRSTKNAISNIEDKISVVVDEDGINGPAIIDAINYTGAAYKINADKVDAQGFVQFTDLSTSGESEINADNLVGGTIADAAGKNSWNLSTGEMEATDLHIDNETVNAHEEFMANAGASSKTSIATDEFVLYDNNGKALGKIGADVSSGNAVNGYMDLYDTRNAPAGQDYSKRLHGDASGIVFYDDSGVTAQYPATGLEMQDLNGNGSELEATSGSTKTYTIGPGVYLISTAKMDDTSADEDSLYMASVGETGISHISEILAPTGTTAVVLSGDTLTVTTGDRNVQIVINKIG